MVHIWDIGYLWFVHDNNGLITDMTLETKVKVRKLSNCAVLNVSMAMYD